jgi:hypothetical protein
MLEKKYPAPLFWKGLWFLLVFIFGIYLPFMTTARTVWEFQSEKSGNRIRAEVQEKIVQVSESNSFRTGTESSSRRRSEDTLYRLRYQVDGKTFETVMQLELFQDHHANEKVVVIVDPNDPHRVVYPGRWIRNSVSILLALVFGLLFLVPTFLFHKKMAREKRILTSGRHFDATIVQVLSSFPPKCVVQMKSPPNQEITLGYSGQSGLGVGAQVKVYYTDFKSDKCMVIYECSEFKIAG